MPNAKEVCNQIVKTAVKHSDEILITFGIAGAAGAIIFAWNEAPKAERIIKENRREAEKNGTEYKKINAVKDTWKHWGPPMAMFAISTACIIGASTVNHKRNAALAAAYSLSEKTFIDYRKKVIESIGEDASKAIEQEVAKESAKENIEKSNEIIFVGGDEVLCYDYTSKQWFMSTKNKLENAAIKCNTRMINGMEMYCSLNDFYDEINSRDLKHLEGLGDYSGWNINKNGAIDLVLGADIREDGKPYITVDFFNKPMSDFNSIY